MRVSFEAWRRHARSLLARGVAPADAAWEAWRGDGSLFADAASADAPTAEREYRVPAAVVSLLEQIACHRDPQRHALMYRLLWRVTHGEHDLLDDAADDDVIRLARMAAAVRLASHKMTAFVRFRELREDEGVRYVAVFAPEHDVLERTAPFFVKRFGTMVWTIVTPDGGAHWDRERLAFFDVDHSTALPAEDATEALWLTYYESIFNPARLNVAMMRKEMPVAYWKHLPEAKRIPALIAGASERAGQMVATTLEREVAPYRIQRGSERGVPDAPRDHALAETTSMRIPGKRTLDSCRRCPLGAKATQGVPGEGPVTARMMLVGEQPGDEEDLSGKPFVGPAGRLLRRALAEAGIDSGAVYITNAVKHFSFEPRGKRRMHKTPAQKEIEACGVWLDAEIDGIAPAVILAMGASALIGVMGQRLKVSEARSMELIHPSGAQVRATYHPSAVLRAIDEPRKAELHAALVSDLRAAFEAAGGASA
ncbi:MAG: UdgX family uracil-DNA binding protein [Betaproteobacteria bacterium]